MIISPGLFAWRVVLGLVAFAIIVIALAILGELRGMNRKG